MLLSMIKSNHSKAGLSQISLTQTANQRSAANHSILKYPHRPLKHPKMFSRIYSILYLAIKLRQMQSRYMYLQNYTHNTSYAHRAYMQVEEAENEKRYIR